MTADEMQKALALKSEAEAIKRRFDKWVLLQLDSCSKPEVINVGDPVSYKTNEYHRVAVTIPDAVRRLAFRQWRKEQALKFNENVRQLAQIGMTTDLRLIEFSPTTGEPL